MRRGSVIRELIEVQVAMLKAQLSEQEIDAEGIAESAEALLLYAKCLRDFPHLPEMLLTEYPEPPQFIEEALYQDIPTEVAEG